MFEMLIRNRRDVEYVVGYMSLEFRGDIYLGVCSIQMFMGLYENTYLEFSERKTEE